MKDMGHGMGHGIWVIHTGDRSKCKMVTLFGSDYDDGLNAGIWAIHTGAKSGYTFWH